MGAVLAEVAVHIVKRGRARTRRSLGYPAGCKRRTFDCGATHSWRIQFCKCNAPYIEPRGNRGLTGLEIVRSQQCFSIYTADSNMSGCKQAGVQRVWMTGKNVSPKNRLCCIPCATWLREEHRAEVMSLCASCRRSFCWSHLMLICRGDRM